MKKVKVLLLKHRRISFQSNGYVQTNKNLFLISCSEELEDDGSATATCKSTY